MIFCKKSSAIFCIGCEISTKFAWGQWQILKLWREIRDRFVSPCWSSDHIWNLEADRTWCDTSTAHTTASPSECNATPPSNCQSMKMPMNNIFVLNYLIIASNKIYLSMKESERWSKLPMAGKKVSILMRKRVISTMYRVTPPGDIEEKYWITLNPWMVSMSK